jgi:hypothetical protein
MVHITAVLTSMFQVPGSCSGSVRGSGFVLRSGFEFYDSADDPNPEPSTSGPRTEPEHALGTRKPGTENLRMFSVA